MRFGKKTFALALIPASVYGLRIEVNGNVALPDPKMAGTTEPVMQSFANHLHSVAGLFSAIIGKGGNPSNQAGSFYNPACYLPETADSDFPNWSGPYCLISYDTEKTCAEEFNCNFLQSFDVKLPSESKLCCRNSNDPWSEKFQESASSMRVFSTSNQENKNNNLPSNAKLISGHYSLSEIIFNSRVKPESDLYLNKFDMGSACEMWGESLGYYSLNPVPETGNYKVKNNGEKQGLAVCAMERKFEVSNSGKEVPSIMPFCSFKITDQACPEYAPLFLTFPKNVVSLPNDELFKAESFIDSSGLCCSLTQHKTVDQTVVNLDYLPAEWTMNNFQVIKWPYAQCPIFEFPKMDLVERNIEFTGNQEYPWAESDLKFSMCEYKQPEKVEAEAPQKSVQPVVAPEEEKTVDEETVDEETVDQETADQEIVDEENAEEAVVKETVESVEVLETPESEIQAAPQKLIEVSETPETAETATENATEVEELLPVSEPNVNEIEVEVGSGVVIDDEESYQN